MDGACELPEALLHTATHWKKYKIGGADFVTFILSNMLEKQTNQHGIAQTFIRVQSSCKSIIVVMFFFSDSGSAT